MKDNAQIDFSPLVSVIIPVYNGARYLAEAIDSALNQSYKSIEILVINDGSDDGGATEAVALQYKDQIRYFSKPNGRVASALNMGIREMRGEYFSWLSHDDLYHPDKIRLQIEALATLQNKNTILYGGYDLIDAKGHKKDAVNFRKKYSLQQLETPLFSVMRGLINGCTLLVSKILLDQVGTFREDLRTTQDYEFWSRLFRTAPVHFIEKNLVQTRIHAGQDTLNVINHIDECDALWIGLINGVTREEASIIDGSYAGFLLQSAAFLKNTLYARASQECDKLADSAIATLKVSVIVPFYNRIPDVLLAIKSVQSQTHQNFEILLINDGSTDDISALNALIQEDKRIIYFVTENRGAAAARNLGMRNATGDYIAFLDSDDLFMPEKLDHQLRYMEKEQFSFSHTDYIARRLNSGQEKVIQSSRQRGQVYPQIIAQCVVATPTVMARRSFISRFAFPEEFRLGEDCCLWIDLAQRESLGALSIPLTMVNVSSDSASQHDAKQMLGVLNICTYVLRSEVHKHATKEISKLLSNITFPYRRKYEHSFLTKCWMDFWHLLGVVILSFRETGLRVTLQKIDSKLRNRFHNFFSHC